MREHARIERMLSLLRSYWHTYPDLRLGQIVSNMANEVREKKRAGTITTADFRPADPFNVEDTDMEEALKDFIAKAAKGR